MIDPSVDVRTVEGTLEHGEGRAAFLAGQSDAVCPYPARKGDSTARMRWMFGYWGTRTERFLERIGGDRPEPDHEPMKPTDED